MKKILMFTKTMELGGTENVIIEICKNLKDKFDITVLSSGGINIVELDKIGIKHIEIPNISSRNPIVFIKNYIFVKGFIKKNDFDIVHTHHRIAAFYISLIKTNAVLIHTMHNTFSDKVLFTRKALKKFTVIPCGKTVMCNLLDFYKIDKNKIFLIENGVSKEYRCENIDKISEIRNIEDSKVFVFVGRLCKQKGVDELLKAWNTISSLNSYLLIYGTGPMEEYVFEQIKEMSNVYYMGYTDNPLNVISKCDCLILPSRWEGLPLTIMEAMAVKTQVICSNIMPNIEIIDSNEIGYTYSLGNYIELGKIIDDFSLGLLIDTTERAYDRYLKFYSSEALIEKYKMLYEKKTKNEKLV